LVREYAYVVLRKKIGIQQNSSISSAILCRYIWGYERCASYWWLG